MASMQSQVHHENSKQKMTGDIISALNGSCGTTTICVG